MASNFAPRATGPADLQPLIRAILDDDIAQVAQLLEGTPALATQSLVTGAERQSAVQFFFPQIGHYLYAGDTPLHAAAAGYRIAVAKALLASGASVAAANRRGATPLHYAADGRAVSCVWHSDAQAEMISLLVAGGADPNALDKSGVAPLHRAVRQRCPQAVDALLRSGAVVRLKNKSGSTPLHLAVQNTGKSGSGSPEAKGCQKEIIELLLRAGASPRDRDGRGKTVVQCADRSKSVFDLNTELN